MGTFYTGCVIENYVNRSKAARIPKLLVDVGSEYTWVSAATLEKIGIGREKKTWCLSWPTASRLAEAWVLRSFASESTSPLMKSSLGKSGICFYWVRGR